MAYRETITQATDFSYTHKKQSGGSGQYGKVAGIVSPIGPTTRAKDFQFVNKIRGGSIPTEYIPAVEKGFRASLDKGRLIGFPVIGMQDRDQRRSVALGRLLGNGLPGGGPGRFPRVLRRAKPQILEPIMKLAVEGPSEFQGAILKTIMQRRGQVIGSTEEDGFSTVDAEVPLSEMFGYATDLRSMTQGKAEFSMEFDKYMPGPGRDDRRSSRRSSERRSRTTTRSNPLLHVIQRNPGEFTHRGFFVLAPASPGSGIC